MLAVILEATAGNASRKGDLRTRIFHRQTEFIPLEVSGILAMTYPGVVSTLPFAQDANGAQMEHNWTPAC
jgi:hypothetical protein